MWKSWARSVCAAGMIAWSVAASQAGEVGKMPLAPQALKILDGRLGVRMPAKAKIEPRVNPSIMGADPSTEQEARVVLESGEEKIVLMAYETFSTAGGDFENVVRQIVAKWEDKDTLAVEALPPAGKDKPRAAKVMMITPKGPPEKDAQAIVIREAFVLLPDQTVLVLRLYANPKAYEDKAGCLALGKSILESIEPGPKKLALEAGGRRLPISRRKALEITVPAGYVLLRQDGIDFLVFSLHEVGPLTGLNSTLVLYYGGAPSFHPGSKEGDTKPVESKGKVMGKDLTWHSYANASHGMTISQMESLVADPLGVQEGMFLHLSLATSDAKKLKPLQAMVETLRVVTPETAPSPDTRPRGNTRK